MLLVLVPMLSLFALYVFITALAGRDVISLARARVLKDATSQPVGNFLQQLDTERLFAVLYLAAPSPANLAQLKSEETRTDQATRALRTALTSGKTLSNASATERLANVTLLRAAAALPRLRSQIQARGLTRPQVLTAYNAVVSDAYVLLNRVIMQEPSARIAAQALTLVRMAKSEEILQQENAILLGDMAARAFPPADTQQFTELAGARRTLVSQTLSDLDPAYRAIVRRDVTPQATAALTSLEDAVISGSHPGQLPPVRPASWQAAFGAYAAALDRADTQASGALGQQAVSETRSTELRLALAGGLGLLAVAASILVSLLVGRGLVRELAVLRQSAHDLADRRLPDVVRRLAAGQEVDLAGTGAVDIPARSAEIQEVADAFARVRLTAVEAAVGQARLREGMSDVFRKLARRSQSLLHRQLALLDSMERRARDPHLLQDLFRADHLTTRMRRNAENLIILSGQEPARGWSNPVPMVDVLRGAVAEVEDYARIKVICSSDAALAGRAVGDVIHMLAELAENATAFSPPNTPVVMTGDVVGQGFAVEIEDRGLGMSEEKLAEVNDRLADPPSFDPVSADQLGLFVAGQLAKRHSIRIHLRQSPYGGATAIVLIPRTLVVHEEELQQAGAGRESAAQGRHATRDGRATGPEPAVSPGSAPPPAVAGPARPKPALPALPGQASPGQASPGQASPGQASPGQAPPGPDEVRPAAATGPAAAGPAGLGMPELPRRVRQASLAQELRNGTPLSAPPAADTPGPGRTPEDTRATMAAMQHGWERARSVFDPAPPAGPGEPPPDWGGRDEGPDATGSPRERN